MYKENTLTLLTYTEMYRELREKREYLHKIKERDTPPQQQWLTQSYLKDHDTTKVAWARAGEK